VFLVAHNHLQLKDIIKARISRVRYGMFKEKQIEEAVNRIIPARKVEDALANADLIIEATPEELEDKQDLCANFEKHCKPDTIIASTSMRLNLDHVCQFMKKPDRFIGMRFLAPVLLINHVEVSCSGTTSDDTWGRAVSWLQEQEKLPFPAGKKHRIFSPTEIDELQARGSVTKLQKVHHGAIHVLSVQSCNFRTPILIEQCVSVCAF
jgi:3-hydroxyacyl-CoA dehydrogenase